MSDAQERGPQSPGDSPSNVVDEELFRRLVELEINKASRLQYCVSLVCVTPTEGDQELDPAFARRAAEAVSRHFRVTDVLTPRPPASIWLLLINAETRDLPEIFRRTSSELEAHGPAAGATHPMTWTAGGSCYPQTATSGADLLGQATELTSRARSQRASTLILPA